MEGWRLNNLPQITYDVAPIKENTDLVYGAFMGVQLTERFGISFGITHYDGGYLRIDMGDTSDAGKQAVFENKATMFDVQLTINLGDQD